MTLVDIVVEDPGWQQIPLADLANRAARVALGENRLDPERFEISLLACSDDRIAELNEEFRGKAEATNVLSWPAFNLVPGAGTGLPRAPDGTRLPLGDVAIALQTTRAEAAAAAIPLKNHILHLILHSTLHLLGYDHLHEAEAEKMERMESAVLARIGVPDPYNRGDAAGPQVE
ncbi:MAG: rRNA maturation RNase YbeY [Pseudomonadota bacterium]